MVRPDVGVGSDVAYGVIQQADGKLVVAGSSSRGGNNNFSLVRLNTNGTFDTTFDVDGKVVIAVSQSNDRGYSVIQQTDGKLVLAGYSDSGTSDDFSLVRLNADRSLDVRVRPRWNTCGACVNFCQ